MKFKINEMRKRMQQTFDKNTIVIHKKGAIINVYDMIQENREDTEIEPTLKKYGCIPTEKLDATKIYEDFTRYTDLRGAQEMMIKAKSMFYSLPIDTRTHFNNNIDTFIKEGKKYVENLIEKEKQPENQTTTPQINEKKE